MEWLEVFGLLVLAAGLGFVGYRLLGSGYRRSASGAGQNAPEKLTLTAIGNDRWRKGIAANAIAAPFFTRGFADGGCYSVRENGGIIRFLVNEEESIAVCITETYKGEHSVEIATWYDDGTEWMYSNQPGDMRVHRPGCTRYYAPKLQPEALYGKLKLERLKKKTKKITINNVDGEYATMWGAHQTWLKKQG